MPKPLLHFGNIGLMGKGVGGCRCSHRMDTQAVHLDVEAGFRTVFFNDVPVDGIRIKGPVQRAGAIVAHGTKEGAV